MSFLELIEAVRRDPGHVVVPASWGQGRASYGGLVAALLYEVMQAQVGEGRLLRSLAITFVGPLQVDQPARYEAELLREGKAVSQVLGKVVQDGQVVTVIQGSFGAGRQSQVHVGSLPAPAMPALDACSPRLFVPGRMPEFVRYLDLRWGEGGLPFSRNVSRSMGGWVRFHEPVGEPLLPAQVLALVDAWPPALLPHLSSPAPSSSLTWTIEFVQPMPALTSHDWCLYHAEIEHARDGYGHVAAGLWSAAGELIALSRQTVTVFG